MSSTPQLSLDERERRAWLRAEDLRRKQEEDRARRAGTQSTRAPSPQPAIAAIEAMRAPVQPPRSGLSPPKAGESLFETYSNLADPIAFSTDEEEVEELLRLGVGVGSSYDEERYREAAWDPSPHKNPPAYLKHINPVTREPWTIDTQVYNTVFDQRSFERPQRYGTASKASIDRDKDDDPRKRPKGARQGWNSQPFRPTPYALRGMRPGPTSKEPWVEDQRTRQQSGFEDTDVIENLTLEDMDNGGASRNKFFKNYRAESGKVNGKALPPWDYSTRTWR